MWTRRAGEEGGGRGRGQRLAAPANFARAVTSLQGGQWQPADCPVLSRRIIRCSTRVQARLGRAGRGRAGRCGAGQGRAANYELKHSLPLALARPEQTVSPSRPPWSMEQGVGGGRLHSRLARAASRTLSMDWRPIMSRIPPPTTPNSGCLTCPFPSLPVPSLPSQRSRAGRGGAGRPGQAHLKERNLCNSDRRERRIQMKPSLFSLGSSRGQRTEDGGRRTRYLNREDRSLQS